MTFSFCDMDYSESSIERKKSEQNDILVLFTFMLFYKLTIVPQTRQRSCPIVHSQIRKLKHVDALNQER